MDNLTLDVLSWEYVSDGISSLELFERGDITSTSMTSEEVASVRGSEWEKYVYLSEKTVTTYWYSFNFTSRNPEKPSLRESKLLLTAKKDGDAIHVVLRDNEWSSD